MSMATGNPKQISTDFDNGGAQTQPPPVKLDHVADFYRRYPGEAITFFTRIMCPPDPDNQRQEISHIKARIVIPASMELEDYQVHTAQLDSSSQASQPQGRPSQEQGHIAVRVDAETGDSYVLWTSPRPVPDTVWEFQIRASVLPRNLTATASHATRAGRSTDQWDQEMLESRAELEVNLTDEGGFETQAFVAIAVSYKSCYMQYLPAIYESNDLMNRFLMLFEHYWEPLKGLIAVLPLYFDPTITPPDFLPWLASWFNLALDESLPLERRRALTQKAITLYRKRGTKEGLQDYLQTYTGGEARITEHRANNFCLGEDARLGPGIALGAHNRPHTFSVRLYMPAAAGATKSGYRTQTDADRRSADRRMIEALIETEKPAQTDYTLEIMYTESRLTHDV